MQYAHNPNSDSSPIVCDDANFPYDHVLSPLDYISNISLCAYQSNWQQPDISFFLPIAIDLTVTSYKLSFLPHAI